MAMEESDSLALAVKLSLEVPRRALPTVVRGSNPGGGLQEEDSRRRRQSLLEAEAAIERAAAVVVGPLDQPTSPPPPPSRLAAPPALPPVRTPGAGTTPPATPVLPSRPAPLAAELDLPADGQKEVVYPVAKTPRPVNAAAAATAAARAECASLVFHTTQEIIDS